MAVRSARSTVALAIVTLLVAVAAVFLLPGTARAQDLNCDDFEYQEDAQAVLDADPTDPNRLDGLTADEKDGVACESLPHRPSGISTTAPVTTTTTTTRSVSGGTTTSTSSTTSTSTTSTTTTSTTTSTSISDDDSDSGSSDDDSDDSGDDSDDDSSSTSDSDRDCADFASQADANAALDADLTDPDNLDADDDGIACEQHFGEPGQQVQVHPVGGVDTGGGPAGA